MLPWVEAEPLLPWVGVEPEGGVEPLHFGVALELVFLGVGRYPYSSGVRLDLCSLKVRLKLCSLGLRTVSTSVPLGW